MTEEVDVAEVTAVERRVYSQFFEHLGISDDNQTTFLCTLLRNVYDSTSKLDAHLAPHGASIHSAVSRMFVSDNPREAPCHRWIRVYDRMGFFADDDRHAERVVNCGLAYAYRFMEADALAEANAVLLGAVPQKARAAVDDDLVEKEDVPDGGLVVQSNVGTAMAASVASTILGRGAGTGGGDAVEMGAPSADLAASGLQAPVAPQGESGSNDSDDELAFPAGGMSFTQSPGGPSSLVTASIDLTGSAAPAAADNHAPSTATQVDELFEPAVPNGGTVVSAARQAAAAALEDTLSDQERQTADADVVNGPSPSHLVFERQPKVFPNDQAVETVGAVLRGVGSQPDGADILRKLLDHSLLCLARTVPGADLPTARTDPNGSAAEWAAVNKINSKWWPTWEAPQDLGAVLPPQGTFAYQANRKQRAASSRWNMLVDMEGINRVLEEIDVGRSRYFSKAKLIDTETVVRVHYNKPMRLAVVVACMLLLVVKEERFGPILERMAATGRSSVQRHGRLSTAGRHEFFSSGLRQPQAAAARAVPNGTSGRPAQGSIAPAPTDTAVDLERQIAAMDVRLSAEQVAEAAERRVRRTQVRRAKMLHRIPPSPPAGGSSQAASERPAAATAALPESPGSGSKRALVNLVRHPSSTPSSDRPPKGVKRPRTPRKTTAKSRPAAAPRAGKATAKSVKSATQCAVGASGVDGVAAGAAGGHSAPPPAGGARGGSGDAVVPTVALTGATDQCAGEEGGGAAPGEPAMPSVGVTCGERGALLHTASLGGVVSHGGGRGTPGPASGAPSELRSVLRRGGEGLTPTGILLRHLFLFLWSP